MRVTIIGAGIVGLATGIKLLEKNPALEISFIEKENDVALHQTGHNSGVIHSGIYYKPGSLKAENCRRGYKMLLDFCDEHGIEYDICGKVIVATDEREKEYLNVLYERGLENGLEGIKIISSEELKDYEPHANGVAAIHIPQTGIIDFREVARKFKEVIESKGGQFFFGESVKNIVVESDEVRTITNKSEHSADYLISCAGLQSDRIARMTHPNLDLRIIPFRGEYYKIKEEKRYLVRNLIYPVPDPAFPFLGVHFTRMIDGEREAGPNAVFSFKREGYAKTSFDLKDTIESFTWPGFLKVASKYWKTGLGEFYRSYSKTAFVKALQRLLPEISANDLEPGGSGVRAQACDKKGGLLDDFAIVEGYKVTHVCNAPSPAATASLSIGDYIAEAVIKKL